MNLRELIKNVDKTEDGFRESIDVESLVEELKIPYDFYDEIRDEIYKLDEKEEVLYSYYFATHYCTDQYVGQAVLYLKKKPVAITSQTGRKCPIKYRWVHKGSAENVREYLLSLVKKEELDHLEFLNLEEEVNPKGYLVDYADQLMQDKVYYQDELYEVVDKNPSREIIGQTIIIRKDKYSSKKEVSIRDCLVPYLLKSE